MVMKATVITRRQVPLFSSPVVSRSQAWQQDSSHQISRCMYFTEGRNLGSSRLLSVIIICYSDALFGSIWEKAEQSKYSLYIHLA